VDIGEELVVWKTRVTSFSFGVVWSYAELIAGRREISSGISEVLVL
jgi:hypothetical protein